jgi:hypothetical protein
MYYSHYWLPDTLLSEKVIAGQSVIIWIINIFNLLITMTFALLLNKSLIEKVLKKIIRIFKRK